MTAAHRWLDSRLGDAPAELQHAMQQALAKEDGPVAEALAGAAIDLYGRVVASAGGRADALPLLAADALLTHALEAQAEDDPAGLADFVERWGAAGRLGKLAHQVEV